MLLIGRAGWEICFNQKYYPNLGGDTSSVWHGPISIYLTIIPRARMGSESIAHEAEGQLVGQKYRE